MLRYVELHGAWQAYLPHEDPSAPEVLRPHVHCDHPRVDHCLDVGPRTRSPPSLYGGGPNTFGSGLRGSSASAAAQGPV